jgi:hypothetical protein
MAEEILCPNCNKPNPEALEICQYCGTIMKKPFNTTEPLDALHPGDMPTKRATSDLERTLPGWLRSIRKGDESDEQPARAPDALQNQPAAPATPAQQPKPEPPKKKESSPLDFLAGLAQDNDEEDAIPDWMAGLQSSLPETPAPAAQEQTPTDWLADLKGEATPQAAEPEPALDWGFNAGPSLDFNATEEPAPPILDDTPDWLAALKAQDEAAAPVFPPPAASAQTDDAFSGDTSFGGDVPDWLNTLESDVKGKQTLPAAVPPLSEPASALDFNAPPAQDLPSTGDLPDWLSSMGQESALAAETQAAESAITENQPFGGDLPDWLSGLSDEIPSQKPPVESAPPAVTTPLAFAFDKEPEPVVLPSSEPAPLADEFPALGDLPDWLSSLDQEPAKPAVDSVPTLKLPVAEPPAPPAEIKPPAVDLTDWLSGLDEEPAAPVESASAGLTSGEEPSSAGEFPDWLSAAIGEAPAAQTPPAVEPKSSAESKSAKAFSTGALNEMGISPTNEIPDWMAGLTSAAATGAALAASQPEQLSAKPAEPAPESAALFADLGSLGELPDWLGGAGESKETPPVQETPLETVTKATAGSESRVEKPNAAPTPKSPASEPTPDSIFSMDVPDWLSGFTPTETEMAPAAEEEPGLGQAELPSWVQAMRPMEAVISSAAGEDDDQVVEKEGPLAGFRSVLPVLPGALEIRKPKIYSIKLQVGANQQSQAALLERLIASEASSQPIATPKPVAIIRPLRWIIAAVLLLAVFLPALLGSQVFPLPFVPASETAAFYQTVNELPEAAPVLVVFDYQPGYAGEMESAAAPVIDHLMSKNVRLAFVSSAPSGVLMGERMMAKMHTRHPNYGADAQYVDLGYLPGGAAGIQVFANNPQKTLGANVLRHDVLTNLWILPPLAGAQVLSDFAAVIVLTDNPDTGRLWVEQAGPALGNRPMLMVISAQAEPMIRPYYKSGQLRGMVTGLEGGAAYEQINARPAQARLYWDSYGMGMIATELLIVIGGAWALLTGLRERRESQEEGEG